MNHVQTVFVQFLCVLIFEVVPAFLEDQERSSHYLPAPYLILRAWFNFFSPSGIAILHYAMEE